jgi:hypothetical protein
LRASAELVLSRSVGSPATVTATLTFCLGLALSVVYGPKYVDAAPLAGIGTEDVPLPRPRPPQAGEDTTREAQQALSTSQCFLELTSSNLAIAELLPPVKEQDGCGADDLVRVHAVILQRANRVELKPAPTLRCRLAIELSKWIRQDLAAEVLPLGAKLSDIENDGSYECRPRNNVPDAPISEHGSANAIDIRSFKLTDGKRYEFTDALVNEAVRKSIKASACARFTTVLGPGSDGYHEQHIHLDLKERRNGFRLCQWDVKLPDVQPRHGADDR